MPGPPAPADPAGVEGGLEELGGSFQPQWFCGFVKHKPIQIFLPYVNEIYISRTSENSYKRLREKQKTAFSTYLKIWNLPQALNASDDDDIFQIIYVWRILTFFFGTQLCSFIFTLSSTPWLNETETVLIKCLTPQNSVKQHLLQLLDIASSPFKLVIKISDLVQHHHSFYIKEHFLSQGHQIPDKYQLWKARLTMSSRS